MKEEYGNSECICTITTWINLHSRVEFGHQITFHIRRWSPKSIIITCCSQEWFGRVDLDVSSSRPYFGNRHLTKIHFQILEAHQSTRVIKCPHASHPITLHLAIASPIKRLPSANAESIKSIRTPNIPAQKHWTCSDFLGTRTDFPFKLMRRSHDWPRLVSFIA